jgi:hypothetical protein
MQAMLDSQMSVELLLEAHLKGRMQQYPLIVIPEWEYIGAEFKKELISYVQNGGNLVVVGPKSAALFKEQLGVEFEGEPQVRAQWLESGGLMAGIQRLSQRVKAGENAKPFGRIYFEEDLSKEFMPAATIALCGKGKIAGVYFNAGEHYITSRTAVLRAFLESLAREMFPEPAAEVTGSHNVEVAVNRINGKLAVNLLNTSGPHADKNIRTFDEIPSVGPLKVCIRTGAKPRKIRIEPEGYDVKFAFKDGRAEFMLPKLEIHEIVVVEP